MFPQTGQYSLSFDGTDDYVEVSNQDQSGEFSVAIWFKRGRTGGSGNADRLFLSVNNNGWGFGFQDDGTADKDKLFWSKVGVSQILSTGSIADTDWHHVVIVFSESGTNTKIYIDGALDSSQVYGPNFNSGGGNYTLAARGASEFFLGKVGQFAIFPYLLSATQIGELYRGQYDPTTIGPGMSWQFTEGSGTTTADGTGNGNTGTLNGGVTWSTDVPDALRLNFAPRHEITTGPPMLGAPWTVTPPRQYEWLQVFPPGQGPAPLPPVGGYLAYPLEIMAGPPMAGAPWFRPGSPPNNYSGPSTAPSPSPSPVPGGGGVPVPGGTTQTVQFVPRYNPNDVTGRSDRLQRFTEIVSQIINSLLTQGLIRQTSFNPPTWTIAGGAGGVLSFDGRAGVVTLSAADIASAYSSILPNQFLAGAPLQARAIGASDLPFSGVAAGGYPWPNLIVDQYGRITTAGNNTFGTPTGVTAGHTAGGGTAVTDDSTFDGGLGGSAWTIGDLVFWAKTRGLLPL